MLRLRRARLRERIGIILLLHAALMVGAVVLFMLEPDGGKGAPLYRLPDPGRVALIATAFEHTPPDTHADLARAFSDSMIHVRLLPAMPDGPQGPVTHLTLVRYRDALGGRPFHIEAFGPHPPASLDARPAFAADGVRISVALPDGHAIGIVQTVTAPIAKLIANRILFFLAILVIDALVVLWLASQTTGPVERLVRAVRDDRLDALKPGGPREIADLAEAFRQLRQRLRDLMNERTRMLAAIAHDYRTYLTRLELRSEFIEDEEQRVLAAQDLGEMRELLSDTLTFARESTSEETDGATCNVAEELRTIVAERRARHEDIGTVTLLKPVFVHASHVSFQRMLANLLDNAVRYGGGRAFVRLQAERDLVHICVEDEGPGVPPGSLERLLEPFERLEPSRARQTGGVGLGLSIVQALAHRYQGTLALENRAEGGFRAILTLRLAGAPAPAR